MHVYYKNFEIELFNDQSYDPQSNDNVNRYNKVYKNTSHYQRTSAHGIRIYEDEIEISSAIILRTGGPTIIHPHAFIIKNDVLFLCCCANICAFSLPSLDLKWEQECDIATCFEIYEYENDLIIHGECEISRITSNGLIKWQFSGRDIFVTRDGKKAFEIVENTIIAHDFEGYRYVINGDGKAIN